MKKATQKPTTNQLTILVFVREKDYELHKTILSLLAATKHITSTIKIVVDRSKKTRLLEQYLQDNSNFLNKECVEVIEQESSQTQFKTLVSAKTSTYTVLIEAGDCIGPQTLTNMVDEMSGNSRSIGYAHTEVYYSKNQHKLNSVVETPNFPDDTATTLLSSFENQYFSHFLIVPTEELEQYSQPTPKRGYVQSNWHLVTTLLNAGLSLRRIPYTVVFSCHRPSDEDRYALTYSSPLYSLEKLRTLAPQADTASVVAPTTKERIKELLKNNPKVIKVAQKGLHYLDLAKKKLPTKSGGNDLNPVEDAWLINETQSVHLYNSSVFLTASKKFHIHRTQGSLKQSFEIGSSLAQGSVSLRSDSYDYVLIVPWLIAGGADMFFVNYANTIAKLHPDKKVLVVSTEPSRKSLSNKQLGISDEVDFLRLAEIVGENKNSDTVILRTLALLIEIVSPAILHVGLSRLGYKYIEKFTDPIKDSGKKIVLTGYNEIITDEKKREGYVHDAIPAIFTLSDVVTTDNNEIAKLWQQEYGLSNEKVLIHHQPFKLPETTRENIEEFNAKRPVRVLWAAHMRKEKNPVLFAELAKKFSNNPNFKFTAYGALDPVHYRRNPFNAIQNLEYKGAYKSFFKDINPDNYDIFVYTSLADGTPNILIEAGLAGIPIISSEVGGIGKLINTDGVLIADPTDLDGFTDALSQFQKDPTDQYKKADSFKKRLGKTQTMESFTKEVNEMLEKVRY